MKKVFSLFLLLTYGICSGQNLVPNGDFEQYWGCPAGYDHIDSAKFWTRPSLGTSDYFNQCSSLLVGVPTNFLGYQQAHSGGGYGGLYLYTQLPLAVQYREYIEVPLISALIDGVCYHFEMYVNLGNRCVYSTDNIGIYFSDTLISGITYSSALPFTPQIISTAGFISDISNWTLVSGNYSSMGGEAYIVIGNFKNDALTDTISVLGTLTGNISGSYIYVDGVSLVDCTSTEVNEKITRETINLFPNPVTNKLTININNYEPTEITLYDLSSRILFQQTFTNTTTINTEQLAKGMYLYTVRNKNGIIKTGKVIKE